MCILSAGLETFEEEMPQAHQGVRKISGAWVVTCQKTVFVKG
jgi:hypothetical protein